MLMFPVLEIQSEALALYFDEPGSETEFPVINETLLGEISVNV